MLIRTNFNEGKVTIGGAHLSYLIKVQKAFQPLITDITHYTMRTFPAYEHSRFVEEELIKKHIIYTNPTPSEIQVDG
jgi:hypothetical protein